MVLLYTNPSLAMFSVHSVFYDVRSSVIIILRQLSTESPQSPFPPSALSYNNSSNNKTATKQPPATSKSKTTGVEI